MVAMSRSPPANWAGMRASEDVGDPLIRIGFVFALRGGPRVRRDLPQHVRVETLTPTFAVFEIGFVPQYAFRAPKQKLQRGPCSQRRGAASAVPASAGADPA